jgi:DNA-directed RNA polymerase subunit RPC12/RpoP
MTNESCLEGIACPKCGNDERVIIAVKTLATVTDDGAEPFGDMEWDDDSFARCPECDHWGRLGAFRLPADAAELTDLSKE